MDSLVRIENNEVVVSSRDVAKSFGKEHKNVLVNIRDILVADFSATKYFHESTHEYRGQQFPEYIMNRDGFSLLVMGFNGKAALAWKIKYIDAFNEMERQLREGHQMTPAEQMARGLLAAKALLDEANKTIALMQPKADFYDAVANSETLMSMGDVAKTLAVKGLGRNNLFRALRDAKILDDRNVPYQRYVNAGYFKLIESTCSVNSSNAVFTTTYVTQRGVDYINTLIKEGLIA